MSNSMYEIVSNEIRFSNGGVARFEFPIVHAMQFEDVVVVVVWAGREGPYNENVFGVDLSGNILWQIEPQYPSTVRMAFGGLEKSGKYAVVSDVLSAAIYLNPATGEVVKREEQPY